MNDDTGQLTREGDAGETAAQLASTRPTKRARERALLSVAVFLVSSLVLATSPFAAYPHWQPLGASTLWWALGAATFALSAIASAAAWLIYRIVQARDGALDWLLLAAYGVCAVMQTQIMADLVQVSVLAVLRTLFLETWPNGH